LSSILRHEVVIYLKCLKIKEMLEIKGFAC